MKYLLVFAALATAAPTAFVASEATAQVLTGRGSSSRANAPSRRRPPPPPPTSGLSAAEEAELRNAQAEVAAIDARIVEYERLNADGSLTAETRARWEADLARRADLSDVIEVLISLRDE